MRQTQRLLRKSFWGRSYEELARLSNIALKLEGIKGPSGPYVLHDFRGPDSVSDCKVMSDADIGGFSTAHLDWVSQAASSRTPTSPDADAPATPYARFHGTISNELPPEKLEIKRSGYAGWRTQDRPPTIFGRSLWDIDPYTYLAVRIKSDGRSYFINVQTDSIVPTDLHQHRLFTKRPGEWETVMVKWNDFVRTNHGFVVEPQTEMLRQKVKSIGFGLTDRVPGPFELCIGRMWATNHLEEADVDETAASHEGELKNRHGETISWRNQ
ncbi:CIA30-domain-containing protein [Thozetella sp. PMI_491]|nr:CIA30-domain-containing protein [Thozetella sp. PMI_491]